MRREEKERAAGWSISLGVHIVLLMIVAATGLFHAVSSESHPVDVEIYDNVTEDEEPSEETNSAQSAAAAPEAAVSEPILIEESALLTDREKEPQEKEAPQDAKKDKASEQQKPAGEGKPSGKTGGKPGGDAAASGGGPARDPAHVRHVKVHAQQLSTVQPAYPIVLQAKKAVGSVTVDYIINASGAVESPQLETSSGYPEMDAAALSAIAQFTYSPARNDYDEPVSTHGRYTFRFHP